MHNVTLRRVHETIVAVEKQLIFQCVCACVLGRGRVHGCRHVLARV